MTRLLVSIFAVTISASAQLGVTEINSDGTPTDFWELTNFGGTTVDLSGYKWDDESANPNDAAAVTIPSGTLIEAGESILFSVSSSPAVFRAAWNLPETVQVISGGPGLGQGDRVYLFNASNVQVTNLNYAAGGFTRNTGATSLGGHAGLSAGGSSGAQSLIIDPNFSASSPRYTFATGGNFDSYAANSPNTSIGSPGAIGEAGTNSAPAFALPTSTYWTAGTALTNSAFRVSATDTDAGQSVTLSVLDKPAWLTLTADGTARYRLTGTPPSAEDYTFTVRATDDFATPATTDQVFTLVALPATSPIILNEYNSVSSTDYLRGGTASADADGVSPGPTDATFGRVLGNGGQWVEFVVVGNGSANSTTDMRGWTIRIQSTSGSATLVLSQNPYWSNVRAGTILTFIQNDSANGGLDTSIHRTSALHTAGGGYLWSNIFVGDPVYISQTSSDLGGDLGIGSDDTTFTVFDAGNTRIYGPAGESIAAYDSDSNGSLDATYGVSSTEILRVEENPAPSVNPISGAHNDASTFSTFGARNRWGAGGVNSQSFAAFATSNSPPRFTSTPENTQVTDSFSYPITTADPNGHSVTVGAAALPSFLTLTPGASGTATLATHRDLTLADAGQYLIELTADDGQPVANTTPQAFYLNVFHTAPSLILNEYNAVGASEFLNGGDAITDDDGVPLSEDGWFGRVIGNGGPWFELVVTGDGGAGTVDLRGWTIEIGTSWSGEFVASNTLVLSADDAWSAVPTGTLLTFSGWNSANGGLDTGLSLRDRSATLGDRWTNVWIGDAALLVQTSPEVNGYTINGGVVENLGINQDNTQFVLKNPLGQRVFGPAGEGIAPLSGVSSTEILQLDANPTAGLLPLLVDENSPYTATAAASTFGLPNGAQDFSPYVVEPTPYELWAESFELEGDSALASADPDGDDRDNFTEYAFGGDPSQADAGPAPTMVVGDGTAEWKFVLRDDDSIQLALQRSTTLESWSPLEAATTVEAHPSLAGYQWMTVTITPAPENGREFFRAVATPGG